jgi:hypothetical protein
MELSAGGLLVMIDFATAESAYIQHSRVPVAVVAMALASPTFARGRFPKLRLVDVVAKAPAMDDIEKRALAAVCGVNIADVPFGSSLVPAFAAHLMEVITLYKLDALFVRDPSRVFNSIDIRPGGIDRRTDAVDPKAMVEWRRAFKVLPPARQMIVATIICLYRGEADTLWLARLPATWHAEDAIATWHAAGAITTLALADGALRDWGRLVALYPGW